MKRWSIKLRIMVSLLMIMVIGIASQAGLIAVISSNIARDLSEQIATQATERYAHEFEAIGAEIYGTVTTVASMVESFEGKEGGREETVSMLAKMVLTNDNMLALWTCWEPNAFDGKDAEYVNAPYHDGSGRFTPYVYRDGKNVNYCALTDYDDVVLGDYYQGAKSTQKVYVTDPYNYEVGGRSVLIFSIAVPIVENGVTLGVVGVDVTLEYIASILNAVKIMDDGYIFSLSPNGYFASHPTEQFLMDSYTNYWMENYTDKISRLLTHGERFQVIADSIVLNEKIIFSGAQIKFGEIDRAWMIGSIIPISTVNKASDTLTALIIVAGILLTILVSLVVFLIVRLSLRELPQLSGIAEKLSQGEIDVALGSVLEGNTKNEVVLLKRSFQKLIDMTKAQAENIRLIAKGDYSFRVTPKSNTDVLNMELRNMLDTNNDVFSDIKMASSHVSGCSRQVAQSAQELASSSVEQAASIEEFSSTLANFEKRVEQNVGNTQSAQETNREVEALVKESVQSMGEMLEAMREIDQSSKNITKIIRVIDEIAFQTNILALNAAVEAARAGQHGKGFAVVADEVRNLASKSAAAAKETAELIEGSSQKVSEGNRLVEQTNKRLESVNENALKSVHLVTEIANASHEQAKSIQEMTQVMEQITSVIQANSSTAEQSSAAAQEMSAQSAILADIVARFHLRE